MLTFKLDRLARPNEPQPASAVVDGLRAMLAANAQRYDDIFTRFDGD